MRNSILFSSLVFLLAACGGSKSPEDCKVAEGSQWSSLKKNCVKLADVKFSLKPQEAVADKSGMAYLVFSSDSKRAEALLPGNQSTGILIRSDDVKPWMNTKWSLEVHGKYVLKMDGIVMYTE